MKTFAVAAMAGIAVTSSAQTLDLNWSFLDGSLQSVNLQTAGAGTYFAVLTMNISALTTELTTISPDHDFGLAGLFAGNLDFTGGLSYGGTFLAGSQVGTPGTSGNAAFTEDATGTFPANRFLVAGPEVLKWNANNPLTANGGVFQINYDGSGTGSIGLYNTDFVFGLFSGSETAFGISVNTTDGTPFDDTDMTIPQENGYDAFFAVPAPTAAGVFGLAGLAAARRRR